MERNDGIARRKNEIVHTATCVSVFTCISVSAWLSLLACREPVAAEVRSQKAGSYVIRVPDT